RRGSYSVKKHFDALIGAPVLVLAPEAHQEHRPPSIGKPPQVFCALRVVIAFQQLGSVPDLIGAVTHHIAHQTYNRQADRLLRGFAQGWQAIIVLAAEVAEAVHASAGEKALAGAG